jgi:hypothetical protein
VTADNGGPGRQPPSLERVLQVVTAIIAPTTLLTALLFYFGWLRTNSLFRHFGVEATALGFTTQDYLLRSGEALYAPLGTLLVAALAGLWVHGLVSAWLASGDRHEWLRPAAAGLGIAGLALFAVGVAAILLPRLFQPESLVPPLCLGLGAVLGAYGRWLWQRDLELKDSSHGGGRPGWAGLVNLVLVVLLVVLSLFWATTNYAQGYGRGRAAVFARNLAARPGVVVYSAERLFLGGPGVVETTLPAAEHASYRYRYGGLRLLTESRGRLFLLPEEWTPADGSAIVLAVDDKVRVEFVPGLGS